jgi:subtilisin family serine protease
LPSQIAGFVGYYHFWRPSQVDLSSNEDQNSKKELLAESQVVWLEQQVLQEITFDAFERPKDPCFKKQWHLVNEGQVGGPSGLDINVLPAWKKGLTGKGVVVAVLDTGLYHNHPDLKRSYRADVSYDFVDNDIDPMPVPDKYSNYSHGTLVGGIIAASRNSVCGVGVAYDADLGGIRLPQDTLTDIVAATALTFQLGKVDIYSNSWALPSNGKSLGGPGRLTTRKLEDAVAKVDLHPNNYL